MFEILTFALVIYIVCAMPTKKQIRRLADPEAGERRRADLRKLLQDYRGRSCSLSLNDSHYVSPAATLEGTLVDVDDEWMLMETTDGKGRRKRIVIRFDEVSCIKE